MTSYILSFDLGTTSTKAVIVCREGGILGSATYTYDTYYPRANWAEQNPLDWWKAVCVVTQEVLSQSRISSAAIACVVFSGKMLGLIPVDEDGGLVRSRTFIFTDARSAPQASGFLSKFGHKRFYDITGGSQIPALYPLFKIKWLQEHEPEVFKAANKFFQAKGYILHRLTGNFVTDYSDASQTGMFDLSRLCWSKEILYAAGLSEEKLPEVRPSIEVAGYITKEAAEETSLQTKTPVVLGGGDVLCACAGAGVVEAGKFYIYIGSAGWCGTVTKRPSLDFESRQLCLAHIVPGAYAPHHTMYNGGNCEQWIRESAFRLEHHAAKMIDLSIYDIMEMKATSTPPGSNNLLFLPYLRGGDPPFFDPDARGAFVGLNMNHNERHMYRAVLEGVAFQLRMMYDVFLSQDHEIKDIRLIGGGAESRFWRQIIADVFQREMQIPEAVRAAGCLGAAMAGGIAVGMFKNFSEAKEMVRMRDLVIPRKEYADLYDQLYDVFRGLYPALKDSFARLATFETTFPLSSAQE